MIRQIVLFKAKEEIKKEQIERCFNAVSGLKSKIDGIISIDCGENNSQEHKNMGFEYGFIINFQDISSRDYYLSHPEHQKVIREFIAPIVSDVLVFGYDTGRNSH